MSMSTLIRLLGGAAAVLLTVAMTPGTVQAAQSIRLSPLGSFATGVFDEGAAEIVAHDPTTQRLFVVNGGAATIDALDIDDPSAPAFLFAIDVTPYGEQANSVAVDDGVVAAAVQDEDTQAPGVVVFFDTDGRFLRQLPVGALPDMVTFTPDGEWVLVANEGEPSDDYTVDPEGSVSVIDLRDGVANATVRTAGFTAFNNAQLDPSLRIFGPDATVAQDLEPEFITVSEDSRTAWVTLQENNALAIVDIASARVTELVGLGFKDHQRNDTGFDASDEDGVIDIKPRPTRGMYQPDAIAAYQVAGQTYLITANEGDARDYAGFSEEVRVGDLLLDPTAFPDAATLQQDGELGRLKTTTTIGDVDGDGDFDELFSYGARSFSIWTASGQLVFDSGDDLEQLTAVLLPDDFNSTDNENDSFDDRSDDKGPEPEGVAIGNAFGRTYAFVGLERIGGIIAFDVTDPQQPTFVQYLNTRDFAGDAQAATAGDLAPEGLSFIAATDSPSGKPLLAVAFEVSGTTTLFEIEAIDVLPAAFPLFGGQKLDVDKDVSVNGQAVSKGKSGSNSAIAADGDRSFAGQTLPELDPPAFPRNGSDAKVKVTDEGARFVGTTAAFYKEVEIASHRSATFSGGGPFHIDKLKLKKGATINLGPGTYFVNELEMRDDDARIQVTDEPVFLHIGNKLELSGKRPTINSGVRVDGFQIYLHEDAELKAKKADGVDFVGLIYGPRCGKVELEDASLRGPIVVGGELKVKKNVAITYTDVDRALIGAVSTSP